MAVRRTDRLSSAMQILLLAIYLVAVLVSSVVLTLIIFIFLPLKRLWPGLRSAFTKLWVVAVTAVVVAVFGTVVFLNRPGSKVGETYIVIEQGKGAAEIASLVQAEGIIANRSFFMTMVKINRLTNKLRAGKYHFQKPTTVFAALKKLRTGDVFAQKVTIPEGLTTAQIAGIFQKALDADSARFVALAGDPDFCRELGVSDPSLEGFLFPDTYRFYWMIPEDRILRTMVERFQQIFADSLQQRAAKLAMTVRQAITLASMIEREAQVPRERALISAVFHRRLELRIPLQSCSTVLYALGEHKRELTTQDTKVISPYNTYLHRGLPPGPICSPGKSSILAALYPADVDYLYFVSRGDGTHTFSKSLNSHINAKNRIRRERR